MNQCLTKERISDEEYGQSHIKLVGGHVEFLFEACNDQNIITRQVESEEGPRIFAFPMFVLSRKEIKYSKHNQGMSRRSSFLSNFFSAMGSGKY